MTIVAFSPNLGSQRPRVPVRMRKVSSGPERHLPDSEDDDRGDTSRSALSDICHTLPFQLSGLLSSLHFGWTSGC